MIYGIPAGGVSPQPDWNQEDAAKLDYIKNKPDVLKRTGDEMSGPLSMKANINMSGNYIADVADPVLDTDAANRRYIDAKRKTFGATIAASAWSDSEPYTNTVTVAGVKASDMPHIVPIYSDIESAAEAQREAWREIAKGVAGGNSITFTAPYSKPAVDIPIQVEVLR